MYTCNNRVMAMTEDIRTVAKVLFDKTGEKQRLFKDFYYAAGTWKEKRRLIAKAEVMTQGDNNRFIITTLDGEPKELYDTIFF